MDCMICHIYARIDKADFFNGTNFSWEFDFSDFSDRLSDHIFDKYTYFILW